MALFECSVELPHSPETVFDFLIRPANVFQTLPPDSGLTYLSHPDVLELGSQVELQVERYNMVHRAVHAVSAFDPVSRFTEKQLEGPLGEYEHEHVLTPVAAGTMLVDRIVFEPPGGLAGFLITESVIRQEFEKGFVYRHRVLRELLAR